jgi:hypothetical protein
MPELDRREFFVTGATALVIRFASGVGHADPLPAGASPSGIPPAAPATNPEFASMGERASVLINQLDRGLAYTGFPRSFVDRRNPFSLSAPLTTLVSYGNIIQGRQTTLAAIVNNDQNRHQQLSDSANIAESNANDLSQQLGTTIAQWDTDNGTLSTLNAAVDAQSTALSNAQQSFQDAVTRSVSTAAQSGCGFADLVAGVKTLFAISGDIYTIFNSTASLFDLFNGSDPSIGNIQPFVKKIATAGQDINSVLSAYTTIRSSLDPGGKGALIAIQKDDLDQHLQTTFQTIDQVQGPSADDKAAFKNAISDYVAAVQARNQQIITMDALAVQSKDLAHRRDSLLNQATTLNSEAIAALPPSSLVSLDYALSALLLDFLRSVRDIGWYTQRSVDYFLLQPYAATPGLSAGDLATVANFAGQIILGLQNSLTAMPGSPQSFPQDVGSPLSLRVPLTNSMLSLLVNDGLVCQFYPNQKPDQYKNAYAVFADSVKIFFPGIATFAGELTHLGPSRFETSVENNIIEFVVFPPRAQTITEQVVSLGSATSTIMNSDHGGDYIGLSPFSDWKIKITQPSLAILQTAAPIYIEFQFFGSFRARV